MMALSARWLARRWWEGRAFGGNGAEEGHPSHATGGMRSRVHHRNRPHAAYNQRYLLVPGNWFTHWKAILDPIHTRGGGF